MNRPTPILVYAVIGLVMFTAAGPTLVALVRAAVPLVVAVGVAVFVLRLLWYFTNRY